MAQFEVCNDTETGIMSTLTLGDSFDGSTKLVGGSGSNRGGCANALAGAIRRGRDWTKIRHTASLDEKVNRLIAGIAFAVEDGKALVSVFKRATTVILTDAAYDTAFDAFFPEADEEASARAKTLAENRRVAARIAAGMSINNVGRNSLATLWNAATHQVDRNPDGTARKTSGDAVGSLLFGSRGQRVEEVRTLVEVIMADGTVEQMSVDRATGLGVDASQMGADLLAGMLADLN